MINHLELSDDAFESLFSTCQLNPKLFTHEAHVRLAWIHVTKYGVETAVTNIVNQLYQFVTKVGAVDKFNLTLPLLPSERLTILL
jgi:hypothetical protein